MFLAATARVAITQLDEVLPHVSVRNQRKHVRIYTYNVKYNILKHSYY